MQRAVCKVQIIHHSSLRRHLSFIPFHSMNKNRNKLQLQHEHGHKQAQERCSQFADTPSAHHTRSHPLVPAFVFSSIASDKYIRQNPNERQANVLFKITSPSAFHFPSFGSTPEYDHHLAIRKPTWSHRCMLPVVFPVLFLRFQCIIAPNDEPYGRGTCVAKTDPAGQRRSQRRCRTRR